MAISSQVSNVQATPQPRDTQKPIVSNAAAISAAVVRTCMTRAKTLNRIRQLALGVLVGSLLSASAFVAIGPGLSRATPLLPAVAIVMLVVGLLASLAPARRALRIQAVEALRADA
jgi:hypothetical protein